MFLIIHHFTKFLCIYFSSVHRVRLSRLLRDRTRTWTRFVKWWKSLSIKLCYFTCSSDRTRKLKMLINLKTQSGAGNCSFYNSRWSLDGAVSCSDVLNLSWFTPELRLTGTEIKFKEYIYIYIRIVVFLLLQNESFVSTKGAGHLPQSPPCFYSSQNSTATHPHI